MVGRETAGFAIATFPPRIPMNFTIALAQIDSAVGNLQSNISKHLEYVHRAIEGGADLVVFPELSLSGYSVQDAASSAALRVSEPTEIQALLEASHEIAILVGCVEESSRFAIHNSAFYLEQGSIRATHRKIYPPTYGMFDEMRYFSPGTSVRAFDASIGRIGMLVCEDLWHLPLPYILAQDGAEIILAIAASPTRLAGDAERLQNARVNQEQHQAFARLLSTYVVFCNRVGYEDGVNFWGGSEVIGPNGEVVVQAKLFKEVLVFASIDGNEVRRARRSSRHFLDDRPDLVQDELSRIAKDRMK